MMTHAIRRTHGLGILAGLASITLLLGACGADESDDFREALPSRTLLSMDVPAPAETSSSGSKSSALLGAQADLYQLTYDVSRKINKDVWVGLHVIDSIVQHRPTQIVGNTAAWGPLGDALEPLTWTLVVTRKGFTTYDYVLAARKRGDTTGDFEAILAGRSTRFATGFTGVYTANADALAALDPKNRTKTGKLIATYDTRLGRRSVKLAVKGYTNDLGEQSDALYRYLARANRSGEFRFVTKRDMQKNSSAQEIFAVASNWTAAGAGRGDAVVTGGDLASGAAVHVTECWDTSFGRVFYQDSANIDPTEGDAAKCVFTAALPQ